MTAAIFFAIVCFAIGGIFTFTGVRFLMHVKSIENWKRVEGEITKSKVKTTTSYDADAHNNTSTNIYVDIEFSYIFDGKRYTGDKYRPSFGSRSLSRQFAQSEVARYPEGKSVSVAVNPDDPTEAYIETEITSSMMIQTFLPGLVLDGMGLFALIFWFI